FSSRRRHTRSLRDWSSDVCSSDLSCTGTTESSARMCDGTGTCLPGTSQACPTNCQGGACNRTCSDQNPCQTGFYCDAAGTCKLRSEERRVGKEGRSREAPSL